VRRLRGIARRGGIPRGSRVSRGRPPGSHGRRRGTRTTGITDVVVILILTLGTHCSAISEIVQQALASHTCLRSRSRPRSMAIPAARCFDGSGGWGDRPARPMSCSHAARLIEWTELAPACVTFFSKPWRLKVAFTPGQSFRFRSGRWQRHHAAYSIASGSRKTIAPAITAWPAIVSNCADLSRRRVHSALVRSRSGTVCKPPRSEPHASTPGSGRDALLIAPAPASRRSFDAENYLGPIPVLHLVVRRALRIAPAVSPGI